MNAGVNVRIATMVGLTVADYLSRLGIKPEEVFWGVALHHETREPHVCVMVRRPVDGPVRFAYSLFRVDDSTGDKDALAPMVSALSLWNASTQQERQSIVELVEGLGLINRVELIAKLQAKGLYQAARVGE